MEFRSSPQRTWTRRYMKARQTLDKKSLDDPYSFDELHLGARRCVRRERLHQGLDPQNEADEAAAALGVLEKHFGDEPPSTWMLKSAPPKHMATAATRIVTPPSVARLEREEGTTPPM